MKVSIIISFMLYLSFMLIVSQKIMSLGVSMMAFALLIAFLTSLNSSSWFSLILFLIYVTGLLVLFGYLLSLSPNMQHTAKKCFKAYYIIFIPFLILMVQNCMMYKNKIGMENMSLHMVSPYMMLIYLILTLILLLVLLMVVSLTYKSPSPLRKRI